MGKKMTKAGMELRRAIRADLDANPGIDHLKIRRKHVVGEGIVESALAKTVAEWDAAIAGASESPPSSPLGATKETSFATSEPSGSQIPAVIEKSKEIKAVATPITLGIEQGFVKFARKPAKMGSDYILWIPRVYVKNGLVDPTVEYEVYLRKEGK